MNGKFIAQMESYKNFFERHYAWFYEVTVIVLGILVLSFFPHKDKPEYGFDLFSYIWALAYVVYLVYFTSKAIYLYGVSKINETHKMETVSPWKFSFILILFIILSVLGMPYIFISTVLDFWTPWKYTGATSICLMSLIVAFSLTDPNTVILEKVTPISFVALLFGWSICVWLVKSVAQACIPLEWDKEVLAEMDDDELEEGDK